MAYVLVVQFVAVFAAMGVALATGANLEAQKADNFRQATEARLAAESGLTFAADVMKDLLVRAAGDPQPGMPAAIYDHLVQELASQSFADGGTVTLGDDGVVSVPEISLGAGRGSFRFAVRPVSGTLYRLVVAGTCGRARREVAIDYVLQEDRSVLGYAVASGPRVIVRGDLQIAGDVCSMWDRTGDAPPFDVQLGDQAAFGGTLRTVLQPGAFAAAGCDAYIDDDLTVAYRERPVAVYATDDFDTATYRDAATGTLPAPDDTQYEGFPEVDPVTWLNRRLYAGAIDQPKVLHNVTVPACENPRFQHCRFTGYTYVEAPNNVVFENCIFEGPIVTDVPGQFEWTTNVLYFKGSTQITNVVLPESTILAPNFYVDIGEVTVSQGSSKITGLLVGGTVRIRDNVLVEGTVLSTADLGGMAPGDVCNHGTKLGYWEGEMDDPPVAGNIRIIPQPSGQLPAGITKRYTLLSDPDTYVELHGQEG
jgi:hypothetical protein